MFKILTLPFKVIRQAVRFAGVRNSLIVLVGVAIGFLLAPASGAQTRARLQHRIASAKAPRTEGLPADNDLSL